MGRDHSRRNFLVIAMIAVAVIVASFLLRPDGDGGDRAVDPTARPSDQATSQAPDGHEKKKRHKAAEGKEPGPAAGGVGAAPAASVFGVPPGFQGSGSVTDLPAHRVTITWSAPQSAVGVIAWIIPSSQDNERGTTTVYGHSYSLSTTVYGRPKYAAVSAQSDVHGNPITCTITVDGKVTERRTAAKPFSAMWCVG